MRLWFAFGVVTVDSENKCSHKHTKTIHSTHVLHCQRHIDGVVVVDVVIVVVAVVVVVVECRFVDGTARDSAKRTKFAVGCNI